MRQHNSWIFIFLIGLIWACSGDELVSMRELAEGAKLYEANCSNCHQKDGSGLARLLPDIQNSVYYQEKIGDLAGLIRNGSRGGSVINGIQYHLPMPANRKLSDAQLLMLVKFTAQKFGKREAFPTDSILLNSTYPRLIPALP